MFRGALLCVGQCDYGAKTEALHAICDDALLLSSDDHHDGLRFGVYEVSFTDDCLPARQCPLRGRLDSARVLYRRWILFQRVYEQRRCVHGFLDRGYVPGRSIADEISLDWSDTEPIPHRRVPRRTHCGVSVRER